MSESEFEPPVQPPPAPPGADAPPEQPPQPTPPAQTRTLKKTLIIGAALLGLGLWLVLAMLPGILSQKPSEAAPTAPGTAADARRIQAYLFYVSPDGSDLISVVREVPFGATAAEQARRIVEAQVKTPADGNISAIPNGTKVRAVFLGSRGDAYVDLSPEISIGHGGGTLNEALAVFAIVNAITSNLPDVVAVQILVDGKEVDSLAGHLDLRQPIGRANDWIRKGQ